MSSLEGVRVLDVSQLVAGPSAAQQLGDLGADVIKIESPEGDQVRRLGTVRLGSESVGWLAYNRNKRSLVLDLKRPEGREIMDRLVDQADVLIMGYRPGVAARLGLDYDRLSARNPRLIYCSITAFGETGPYQSRAGVDMLLQAEGGLMSINGDAGGPPLRVGLLIVDVVAGLWASQAVLAALVERNRSGLGQRIDLNLLDAAVALQTYPLMEYLISGQLPARTGNSAPLGAPSDLYPTRDQPIIIAAYFPAMWPILCRLVGLPEMIEDPAFRTNADRIRNRAALNARLREVLATRTAEEWLGILEPAGVICGRVQDYADLTRDAQLAHNGMLGETQREDLGVPFVASPPKLSRTPYRVRHPSPRRGEHTALILADAGYTLTEIERLKASGTIG